MPAIVINSLELTLEQKRIIAEAFTSVFSEQTHVDKDRIYVFFQGYPLDSAAKNGKLFSDEPPHAVGAFSEVKHEK